MTSEETWQVSGSVAQKYEQFVASWFEPWAFDLVERARLQVGWRVLDLACGTGVVTRVAAPVVGPTGQIVASDLNEGMLAEARARDADGAPVQWRQADAADLPFLADEFDAVLCQQGLQFVPDKAAAMSEIRRVLRPGGVAAVSVWCSLERNPYIAALAGGIDRHVSAEAGKTMAAPCGFGDGAAFAQLLTGAGFASVQVDEVELARAATPAVEAVVGNLAALPIAGEIQSMEPARRSALLADIVASLGTYVRDGMLTAPSRAHVAVAVA